MNADWKRALDRWETLWGKHKIPARSVSEVKNNEVWVLSNKGITVYPCEEIKNHLKQGENKMNRESQMDDGSRVPGGFDDRPIEVPAEPPVPPMPYPGATIDDMFRPVSIVKAENGFIVEIGCKKFVAEDWKSLASKLGEYWEDPVAAKRKYVK